MSVLSIVKRNLVLGLKELHISNLTIKSDQNLISGANVCDLPHPEGK
jgi:hypothetical protein